MSGEGFINALDDYFTTALLAELGPSGDYTTLVVQDAVATDNYIDEKRTKPFAFAANAGASTITLHNEYSNDSPVSLDGVYEYAIGAVVEGSTREQARQNGLTLLHRITEWYREAAANGLGGTTYGTERVHKADAINSGIAVDEGRAGAASRHTAVAWLTISVQTTAIG